MAASRLTRAVSSFLTAAEKQVAQLGKDVQDEAQRLYQQAQDPLIQERLRQGVKEAGDWAQGVVEEVGRALNQNLSAPRPPDAPADAPVPGSAPSAAPAPVDPPAAEASHHEFSASGQPPRSRSQRPPRTVGPARRAAMNAARPKVRKTLGRRKG